jgi:hypothetical protein
MARRLSTVALRSLLIAVATTASVAMVSAAEAAGTGPGRAKSGSVEAGSPGESAAPRHGPPLHELESRKEGQDYKGRLAPLVVQRRGLAVVTDFSTARLEDWTGAGFTSVDQIEAQLRSMEEHWAWLSRGLESFHWDIIRVTLPVELRPDAYLHGGVFRDAVAPLIRQKVDASEYDSNSDDVIDTAWVIPSSAGCPECTFITDGTTANLGVTMFVDSQNSSSIKGGNTGNFNHEVGHTIGIQDLYGDYGTLSYLTLMDDSWALPPNDFSAYERLLLGWVKPQVISQTKRAISLSQPGDHMQAIRIPGARQSEYFLIEYRRRPTDGFGSTAPVAYDGLTVLHVLNGSTQGQDPPLLKLEPADGSNRPATTPTQTDFFYPGNPGMRLPAPFRSYFGGKEVFRLSHLKRTQGRGLAFDIEIAPKSAPANLLANPSFERGSGALADNWSTQAYQPSAAFNLDKAIVRTGKRSASISASAPNDAWWEQAVSGLTTGKSYALCGWLRGKNILPKAAVGANVSVVGGFVASLGKTGTFDWTESCVTFKPEEANLRVACRLGFFGSTVTGKLWCDDMTLVQLRSAF